MTRVKELLNPRKRSSTTETKLKSKNNPSITE
jgi:hypothetical protein